MQALSSFSKISGYNSSMQTGRPPKTKRTPFGERLYLAREQKGLSLREVAQTLELPLQTYANWERRNVAIRPDHLAKLSSVLEVPLEQLLNSKQPTSSPVRFSGKLRKLFDEVSELPRRQQQRVITTLEDALFAQKAKKVS